MATPVTTSATGPPWPEPELRPTDGVREMRVRREVAAPAVPAIRRMVRRWVVAVGLDEDTAGSVLLAVDEAVTNAVEHAFPRGPGQVWVLLRRAPDGEVVGVVADDGVWQPVPAEPGHRGRGLQLVRALADRAEITGTARGTTVGMSWTRRRVELEIEFMWPNTRTEPAAAGDRTSVPAADPSR